MTKQEEIRELREARGELTFAEIQGFTDEAVEAYWERVWARQEEKDKLPKTQTCPKCKKEISSIWWQTCPYCGGV